MRNLILLSCFFLPATLFAQNLNTYSYANTNRNGIYSILTNPANAAGSTDWLSINLIGAGIGMESNAVRSQLNYSLFQMATFQNNNQSNESDQYFYAEKRGKLPPALYGDAQVLLPSIKVNINPRFSAFFYWRERATTNILNAGSDILPLLINDQLPDSTRTPDLEIDTRMMTYRELAFGFSAVLLEKRQDMLKVGITVKSLRGHSAYIFNTQQYAPSLTAEGLNITSQYRILTTNENTTNANLDNIALSNDAKGNGMSTDIGFVYEHRPYYMRHRYLTHDNKWKNKTFRQRDIVKYDYSIGVSLLDLGYINFNQNVADTTFISTTNVPVATTTTADAYRTEITNNSTPIHFQDNEQLLLPTRLLITFDYRLNKKWFLNAAYSQNLRNPQRATAFFVPSYATATLRREGNRLTYAIPIRLVPRTETVTAGFMAQYGPFFIGTDNFLTFFSRKAYNWSIYTGISIRLKYKSGPTIEDCDRLKI